MLPEKALSFNGEMKSINVVVRLEVEEKFEQTIARIRNSSSSSKLPLPPPAQEAKEEKRGKKRKKEELHINNSQVTQT